MRRRSVRRSGLVAATALVVVCAGTSVASAVPVSTNASAYAAASSNGSASLAASLSLTGSLGGLLNGIVQPVVTGALNPLVAALQSTLNTVIASTLGAGSALHAGTPTTQAAGNAPTGFPADTFPAAAFPTNSPCLSTGTIPCYQAASPSLGSGTLASVSLPLVRGYTEQTSGDTTKPIFGRAQLTNAAVSLPLLSQVISGVSSVVSATAVNSSASCPNDGHTAPSAQVSATSVSVLGGAVAITVANGSLASLTIGGTSYNFGSLPVLTVAGFTVSSYGTALRLTIPLTLNQIAAGLGLASSVISTLLGSAISGSTLSLSIVIGPNTALTSSTAAAWGLGVGIDLSGTLSFDLLRLGLVGASVTVPSGLGGSNYGNLLDLRLAYANCQAGTTTTSGATPAVPPALQ
jgi:hypothetical protein